MGLMLAKPSKFIGFDSKRSPDEGEFQMTPDAIQAAIRRHLPDAEVTVTDLTGTRDHYQVTVRSRAFEGKSRIAQHKMVYGALEGEVGGAIHALALTTSIKG
jgi:stress-induced morphogen